MDVELKAFLQRAEGLLARIEPLLPAQPPVIDWEHTLAARWQRDARSGYLAPLEVNLDLRLDDLIGIDRQRDLLAANTQQFVDGLPANHVLLWGARGTGKSSLIRALLAEYAGRGLRLIEIERDHLADLPRVVELLSGQRQAFVLFCDDLSFEAGEGDYRVLKSVLDGSLERAPENAAVCHVEPPSPGAGAPERQRELADGGRRAASERGGGGQDCLVRSFRPLVVVLSLQPAALPQCGAPLDRFAGRQGAPAMGLGRSAGKDAIRWATGRGNRNGRCAYQYARQWVGARLLDARR